MKALINFIITAILLYVIIAIIAWDIKWITFHWSARMLYIIFSIAFSVTLNLKNYIK